MKAIFLKPKPSVTDGDWSESPRLIIVIIVAFQPPHSFYLAQASFKLHVFLLLPPKY